VLVARFTDHSGQMNTLGVSTMPSGPSVTWPSSTFSSASLSRSFPPVQRKSG